MTKHEMLERLREVAGFDTTFDKFEEHQVALNVTIAASLAENITPEETEQLIEDAQTNVPNREEVWMNCSKFLMDNLTEDQINDWFKCYDTIVPLMISNVELIADSFDGDTERGTLQ
tara:strand:+ start:6412 stop:6762 length:351 start_codon:yes stop_codon:yes gene_type:complete